MVRDRDAAFIPFSAARTTPIFRSIFCLLLGINLAFAGDGTIGVDALKAVLTKHGFGVRDIWLPEPNLNPQTLVVFVPEIHSDKASKSTVKAVFLLQDKFPIKAVLLEVFLPYSAVDQRKSRQRLQEAFALPNDLKLLPDTTSASVEILLEGTDLFFNHAEYDLLIRGSHAFPVIGMDNAETLYLQMVLSVYFGCYAELQVQMLTDRFKNCNGMPCDPQKRGVMQFLLYLEKAAQELSICSQKLGWKDHRSLELKLNQLHSHTSRNGINPMYLFRHTRAFNRFMGEVVLDIRNRIWMETPTVKAILKSRRTGLVIINAGEAHILKPRFYAASKKDLRDYLRERRIGYLVTKTVGEEE